MGTEVLLVLTRVSLSPPKDTGVAEDGWQSQLGKTPPCQELCSNPEP